jgi:hypothetical protein
MTIGQDEGGGLLRKGLKGAVQAAKVGAAGAKQVSDTVTGRGVAEAVAEYEEVSSRVLVGVARDVQQQSDRLDGVEQTMESLATKAEAKKFAEEIERFTMRMERQLSQARVIAIAAVAIGALALVVAVWIAI